MAEFKDLLQRTVSLLEEIDLNYVVVGGLAAIMRGRSRTTTDIDLILKNEPHLLERFFEGLKARDFDVLDTQVQHALEEDFDFSIFDKRSTLRLDIKIAKSTNDLNALKLAREAHYHGLKIRIIPDELIFWGKIQYLGDIQSLTDRELLNFNDVLDFISIYNLYKQNININWLKAQAKETGLNSTLKRLIHLSKKYTEDE